MYLDGEASPLQQEVLFLQLASNQELRQEFTDAMSMGKVFRLERSAVKAPLYLRSKVFANAGISIRDGELAGAAAGTVAAGTAWYALRRFVLPVATMFVGALVTYAALTFGLMNGSGTGTAGSGASAATTEVFNTMGSGSGMPTAPLPTADMPTADMPTASEAAAAFSANTAPDVSGRDLRREINRETNREIMRALNTSPGANIIAASELISDNSGAEAQSNVEPQSANSDLQSDAAFYAQSISNGGAYILPAAYTLQPGSDVLRRADAAQAGYVGTASSVITVQGNRLFSASLFGGNGVKAPIANPSVALMLNIDHQLSVGVSYSRTSFSFSDVSSNGVVLDNPRFTMINAEAQWLSEEPVVFDSKLFSRAAVGVAGLSGSLFGTGSFTVGLHIPVSIFTVQPGISLDGVTVNSRVGSPLHSRVSFVTGIGVGL